MVKSADIKSMERIGPMANDLDWLRDRFQKPVVDEPNFNRNVLNFRPARPSTDQSATVLELVDQAAEVVTGIEDHARQIEARAQSLVKSALDKMQLLENQVVSAAEDLRMAQSRLVTAEDQLLNAEQRAEAAEARERELQHALSRIEEAIRKRLLGTGIGGKTAAVA
jgi:DNA repair exonuclease SbcCD ATPase subunit